MATTTAKAAANKDAVFEWEGKDRTGKQVRGEMRGRYPRHIWPENPLEATPTQRSLKPRGT